MGITFGGYPCLSPDIEAANCLGNNLPLGPWYGKANGFRCTIGQPGRGWILLTRQDLDATGIDNPADFTLQGDQDKVTLTLKNLHIVKAAAVTPGLSRGERDSGAEDADTAFWCEISDRRRLLRGYPIDRAYNVRTLCDATVYYSATLNGAAQWTWSEMVADIWSHFPGNYPGLPFTPDGTPQNFSFYGGYAWDALTEALAAIRCAVKLDPITDELSIIRLSATDVAAIAVLKQLDSDEQRIWDGEPRQPAQGRLPEKVRVLFARRLVNPDTAGGSPWHAVDVTDADGTSAGVISGSVAVIHDTMPAVYDAADALTNSAALASRAAERAADWFRRAKQALRQRVYTGLKTSIRPGSQIQGVYWEDRGTGQGFKTGLLSDDGEPDAATGEQHDSPTWAVWDAPPALSMPSEEVRQWVQYFVVDNPCDAAGGDVTYDNVTVTENLTVNGDTFVSNIYVNDELVFFYQSLTLTLASSVDIVVLNVGLYYFDLSLNVNLFSLNIAFISLDVAFFFTIYNVSATFYLTIKSDDGSTGTPSMRFLTPGGADVKIPPGGSVKCLYDPNVNRIRTDGGSPLSYLQGAADTVPYFDTGSTVSTTAFPSFARTLAGSANAAAARSTLALGTMSTQNANAVAITGGTAAGLTGLGIRDTTAAFDVILAATSGSALTADRTVTINVGNGNRTLTLSAHLFVSGGGTAIISNVNTGDVTLAGETYLTRAGTQVLTAHKITFAQLDSAAVDNDATLAANSATVLPTQQAVKGYVDTWVATAVSWKQSVRVATTANGALATAFENGDTVNGVVLATGDRILLKNQTAGAENGIYVVQASGAPVRATDADTAGELLGATVLVREGTVNPDTQWTLTNDSITLGTTALTWAQISGGTTYGADESTLHLGGTTFSLLEPTLLAFGALTIAANSLTIGSGADAFSQVTFAANTFPARSSTGNLVAKTITDFGLSLVDDADAAAGRTTLGLGTSAVIDTGTSGTKVALLDGANTWSAAQTIETTATIGKAAGTTGAVKLKGTTSGTVTLSVADAAGTHTIKLPTADGTAGQRIQTDGAGQWSWVTSSGVSDGDKGDITVTSSGATWTIDADVVTYAKMQNVSATSRILGRKSAGAGDPEECTLSDALDFIGSAAQGDVLTRGSSVWTRLAAGTTGYFLKSQGAGSPLMWDAASSSITVAAPTLLYANTSIPAGNTVANTAAETAFSSSYTLPANSVAAGDVIRLFATGTYAITGIPTLRIKVKVGSTVVFDSGAISAGAVSGTEPWNVGVEMVIFSTGSSGSFEVHGISEMWQTLSTVSRTAPAGAASTINTTTSQAITVTWTWSAANASNTATLRQLWIEKFTPLVVTGGGGSGASGTAKAWAIFTTVTTTSLTASYGVSGIADNGTGDSTLTWSTPFASTDYPVVASAGSETSGVAIMGVPVATRSASTMRILCRNGSNTATDYSYQSVVAFGDQ